MVTHGWNATKESTRPAVFGVEQEIALYRIKKSDSLAPRMVQLEDIDVEVFTEKFIKSQYQHSADDIQGDTGYYVPDGRIYVDDDLIEFSTAECMNPFELASRISTMRDRLRDYLLKKKKVVAYCDSAGTYESMSFHENYYNDTNYDKATFCEFLLSRIVLSGTGGPTALEYGSKGSRYFCLSPRISYIEMEEGDPAHIVGRYNKRLHVSSSDQIMSPATIALQVGMTAYALRLNELGKLPISSGKFTERVFELNRHKPGKRDENFVKAVEYQREVYESAKQYEEMCRENGYFTLFGEYQSTDYFFNLWDQRLRLLENYCQDWDVTALRHSHEWAAKAVLLDAMRERSGRSQYKKLNAKEIWAMTEFCSFLPRGEAFKQLQEPFLYCDDSYREMFFVPRAADRARLIYKYGNGNGFNISVNWEKVNLSHRSKFKSEMVFPDPFSGFSSKNAPAVVGARETLGSGPEVKPQIVIARD